MSGSVLVLFILVGYIGGVRESCVFLNLVFLQLRGRCDTGEDVE